MNLYKRVIICVTIVALCISNSISLCADNPPYGNVVISESGKFAIIAGEKIDTFGNSEIAGDIAVVDKANQEVTLFGKLNGTIVKNNDKEVNGAIAEVRQLFDSYKKSSGSSVVGSLRNNTYKPGIYKSSSEISIDETVILDADGDSDSKFVFVVTSLKFADNARVWLTNGAVAKNVYWIVENSVNIGSYTDISGTIIAKSNITMNTGAHLSGRIISIDGTVQIRDVFIKISDYTIPVAKKSRYLQLFINKSELVQDGIKRENSLRPIIVNGNTLVPIALLANSLDGKASYTKSTDGRVKDVSFEVKGIRADLSIGSKRIEVFNGAVNSVVYSTIEAQIIDGRTYLPFKTIGEIIKAKVTYGMQPDNSGVEWVKYEFE